MRSALVALLLAVVPMFGLAACGKKKAPASPANTEAAPSDDEKSNEEKSVTAPDEQEEGMQSSDPCEGGE